MDTSYWIQCNPRITVEHTSKKFYGKFLYKIALHCPAGRLIDGKGTMADLLEHRKTVYKHINQSGWWGRNIKNSKDLDHADVTLLETLRTIRKTFSGIKLRVEEPCVQIYANTELELINLVKEQLNKFAYRVESICGPESQESEQLLNSGAIIRKKHNGYRYKVILRDGRYSGGIKDSILQYLNGLSDEQVHITKTCKEMFTKPNSFLWNCYFYTNDPNITTFINLMSPGIVSNIHELVILHQ